jgi:hypothetical protein
VAGTLVLTPMGYRAIETLQVGELVLASDPETGVVKECQILQTFVRDVSTVLDIQVGEEIITCTPEHPFWVPEQGWTQAGMLQVDVELLTRENDIVLVATIEQREGQFAVYNFEVEELHTYFVSDYSVLVHNACNPYDLSLLTTKEASKALGNGIGQTINVKVSSRSEAASLLTEYIQGKGYRNSTGFTGNQVRNYPERFPNGKAGTFHWDYADTQHGGVPHIQIHDFDGSIKRIFFTEGGGLPIRF